MGPLPPLLLLLVLQERTVDPCDEYVPPGFLSSFRFGTVETHFSAPAPRTRRGGDSAAVVRSTRVGRDVLRLTRGPFASELVDPRHDPVVPPVIDLLRRTAADLTIASAEPIDGRKDP